MAQTQVKAFPQAEGFGATATGGRGGDVYHVTNLTDSGPGSLRFGIENAPSAGRTIVFDVGGWINLTSKLGVTRSRITIAGQTAPGGIGVRGSQFSVGASDVIVRHMRFRPGKGAGNNNDSINTNENARRVIYDHISAEFSTDGGFDVQADELTLQYSSVSYGLISHSTGALIQAPGGGAAGKLSFHHNLWAHNETRNPKARAEIIDWLDNVIYNYHNGFIAGDSETNVNPNWRANFDGNTYISNVGGSGRPMMTGGRLQNYDLYYGVNALDRDGNTIDNPITYTRAEAMANQSIVSSAYNWYDEPFEAPPIWRSADPGAAYERVLAEFGATPWERDEVNTRLAGDVVNRTGTRIERESDLVGISNSGFGTLGGVAAPLDSDGDGIPDWWEIKHGTDPFTPSNNDDFDQDGYTDLEDYLNDIAAFKAPGPLDFTGVGRYADSKRWTLRWKPSRLDEVHVNAAAAFVDAVGQKAGTLRIGTEPGSPGKLYVTSGWLEVTDDLEIGAGGTGIVDQYGGEVRVLNGAVDVHDGKYVLRGGELQTPGLFKSANGTFSFLGGTLRAGIVGFDLVNDGGAIAPGFSIGQTSIMGDLTINSGSLEIELASAELADLLVVDGDVMLGGSLDVQLLDDFVPQAGQSWQILTADSILGTFNSITPGFSIELSEGSLWLSAGAGVGEAAGAAVPEPASVMLLVLAVAGLLLQRRRPPRGVMCSLALAAVVGLPAFASADTVKVIADAELRENDMTDSGVATDEGSGSDPALNARFNNNDRNEWIALKFDLSEYDDKSLIENVALRTYMFRSNDNNTKVLRLYALTPGTAGEDWDEATITYGSMPGFTFDANSTTNLLDVGGALTSLGTFSVSGVPNEGNLSMINPTSLTTMVQSMGTNDLLTLLISFDAASNGQWRIASREATQTIAGVLTGAAGDFAPFLQFDLTTFEPGAVQGDYNNDGIVDAADYTVWRDLYGGTGLPNEEVSPGVVDIADFLYWRERFGATTNDLASAAAMAIPEPAGIGLCCLAAVVAVFVRPFSRSS